MIRVWEHQIETDVLACVRRIVDALEIGEIDWTAVETAKRELPRLKRRLYQKWEHIKCPVIEALGLERAEKPFLVGVQIRASWHYFDPTSYHARRVCSPLSPSYFHPGRPFEISQAPHESQNQASAALVETI